MVVLLNISMEALSRLTATFPILPVGVDITPVVPFQTGGDMTANTPFSDDQPWPALSIDYSLYEKHLENTDLSDEQKREFLDTLWHIVVAFVDMGFEVHPVQQVHDEAIDLARLLVRDVMATQVQTVTPPFSEAANDNEANAQKERIA